MTTKLAFLLSRIALTLNTRRTTSTNFYISNQVKHHAMQARKNVTEVFSSNVQSYTSFKYALLTHGVHFACPHVASLGSMKPKNKSCK